MRFNVADSLYEVGDEVEVINPNLVTYGCTGKVVEITNYHVSVWLYAKYPGYRSTVISYNPENIHKLNHCDLKISKNLGKEACNMSKKRKLTGFERIAVIRIGGKEFYYALYNEPIVAGDKVTVTGAESDTVHIVSRIIDLTSDEHLLHFNVISGEFNGQQITEEVSGVLDDSFYQERVAKRKRIADLTKRMDELIATRSEMDKYEQYAKADPVIGDLYNELRELTK